LEKILEAASQAVGYDISVQDILDDFINKSENQLAS